MGTVRFIGRLLHPLALPFLPQLPGPPAQLSETPASIRMPAPHVGQHTEEILTEVCGYSWDDVAGFRALGVVG